MFQTKYQLSDMKFVGYDTIKKKRKKGEFRTVTCSEYITEQYLK